MHQVVTAQLAARRAGTQSTKTRAEVRGGGAKPYRQKGTGNARQGSNPLAAVQRWWRRPRPEAAQVRPEDAEEDDLAGAAFGPVRPRRRGQGRRRRLVGFGQAEHEGRREGARRARHRGSVLLVVVGRDDAAAALSFRNLPEVQLIAPGELNAYDVLCNDWIVFTQEPSGEQHGRCAERRRAGHSRGRHRRVGRGRGDRRRRRRVRRGRGDRLRRRRARRGRDRTADESVEDEAADADATNDESEEEKS